MTTTTKYEIIHNGEIFYTSDHDPFYPSVTRLIGAITVESMRNPGVFSLFKYVGDIPQHVASATAGKKLTKLQYAELYA